MATLELEPAQESRDIQGRSSQQVDIWFVFFVAQRCRAKAIGWFPLPVPPLYLGDRARFHIQSEQRHSSPRDKPGPSDGRCGETAASPAGKSSESTGREPPERNNVLSNVFPTGV